MRVARSAVLLGMFASLGAAGYGLVWGFELLVLVHWVSAGWRARLRPGRERGDGKPERHREQQCDRVPTARGR
jgi:hypothetical protein